MKEAALRLVVLGVLAAAAVAGPLQAAWAQPVNGLYIGGGFGAAFPHARPVAPEVAPGDLQAPVPGRGATSGSAGVGQGSIGYGLGNGLRLEFEGTGGADRLRLPHWP